MITNSFNKVVLYMKPVIMELSELNEVYKTIHSFDSEFVPTLSERGLDLKAYAQKLYEFALVYTLNIDNTESGFVAFYANDLNQKTAYLAQIAVKSHAIKRGFGYLLLKHAMETSKREGMKNMKLEVYSHNYTAIEFYKKNGFTFCENPSGEFCYMHREL